jgi:hypothetical protein
VNAIAMTHLAPRLLAIAAATLVLAACGGGAGTEVLPPNNLTPPSNYTGPPPATADVQSFANNIWINVRASGVAGCGACHSATQEPLFARDDDVNLAYSAALPLLDNVQAASSRLVTKVAGGHNCWLGSTPGSLQACADTMTNWIEAWSSGSGTGGSRQIQLLPPPLRDVGATRNYPSDPALFAATVYPVVREYCAGCHNSASALRQSPLFADGDVATAYEAARTLINLDNPPNSRLVIRLAQEFHNCWSDCASNATEMTDAIAAFAAQVPVTEVDPSLVTSKALTMYDGIVASGGNRYEANQIALWQFKEGAGTTAFDTSGVQPAINLTLSGDVTWVGGWGINIRSGKAQGSTNASRKLHDRIKLTNEYTIEAWAAPANVNQEDTRIVTYSAGTMQRNFTLGQTQYSYDFYGRSTSTSANGAPLLRTADADEDAQATLQHVVVTFDPVNGRRIYVNGTDTGDTDPAPGGTLADWDNTFALVLGNEASNDRQWSGVLRLAAIHDRAMTPTQVQQNFDAGVGEKFYLLFDVSTHVGNPDSYILFEVSQLDSYAYLFNRPIFVSLDEDYVPTAVPLKGLRIGVDGGEVPISQAYQNLDVALGTAGGYDPEIRQQVLSTLGTVVPLQKGPDGDEFFLTFELLGNSVNVRTEPMPLAPPPPPDGTPQPDIGVKIFDEINATMSAATGVPVTHPNVRATYTLVRQSLPAIENPEAFLSSHQIGIAQLAIEYCSVLVDDDSLRGQVFPGFNFNQAANLAYDTGPERDLIISPMINRVLGTNLQSQPEAANVRLEMDNLITQLVSCGAGCDANRTRTVAKAVCSAVLGSAGMLVQ